MSQADAVEHAQQRRVFATACAFEQLLQAIYLTFDTISASRQRLLSRSLKGNECQVSTTNKPKLDA
jgi:hypothetical protein